MSVWAELERSRRWHSICLLGGLDVTSPMLPLMGWHEGDVEPVAKACRLALAHPREELLRSAQEVLLSHLDADEKTRAALMRWAEHGFLDLAQDDPDADSWVSFFRLGAMGIDPEPLGDFGSAVVTLGRNLSQGPVVKLVEQAKANVLSRHDAIIYAAEKLDHDDPCCDDPLYRAQYQASYHEVLAAAARWDGKVAPEDLEELRDTVLDWCADNNRAVLDPLPLVTDLLQPIHARHTP